MALYSLDRFLGCAKMDSVREKLREARLVETGSTDKGSEVRPKCPWPRTNPYRRQPYTGQRVAGAARRQSIGPKAGETANPSHARDVIPMKQTQQADKQSTS